MDSAYEFVLVVWLTTHGPQIRINVPTCAIGREWRDAAERWAIRSGVALNEPGYLCVRIAEWQ